MIRQGDVYWMELGRPFGSEPGYRRPHVVVQNNLLNASRIQTVVCCALTTNLQRAAAPGNVLLRRGEANLPETSVMNVTQLVTADRRRLVEKIGTLSASRLQEVLTGIRWLVEPREAG